MTTRDYRKLEDLCLRSLKNIRIILETLQADREKVFMEEEDTKYDAEAEIQLGKLI